MAAIFLSGLSKVVGSCHTRQDPVPLLPGHGGVRRLQTAAAAHGGVIGQMNGAVEPPRPMVVPKVMIFPRGALAAGEIGRVGCHPDVLLVSIHIRRPKNKKPGLRSSSRAFYFGRLFFGGSVWSRSTHPADGKSAKGTLASLLGCCPRLAAGSLDVGGSSPTMVKMQVCGLS